MKNVTFQVQTAPGQPSPPGIRKSLFGVSRWGHLFTFLQFSLSSLASLKLSLLLGAFPQFDWIFLICISCPGGRPWFHARFHALAGDLGFMPGFMPGFIPGFTPTPIHPAIILFFMLLADYHWCYLYISCYSLSGILLCPVACCKDFICIDVVFVVRIFL